MPEAPCVHCGVEITSDGHGAWVHVTRRGTPGLYRCQAEGVAYGHLAHPTTVACPADGPNPCLGARRDG